MSTKPEWEVLADLALKRLEKDYQRTLLAKPIVRFKEGDVVSLAGMSTAVLEGAKGTVVGPMDPDSLRYPVKILSPEAAVLAYPDGVRCLQDRLALNFASSSSPLSPPPSGYAAMSHDGVVDDAASIGSGSDSSGDDWEAPPTVEGHSTYNLAFEWSDGSSGGGDDAAGRPPAAEVKQTPALDCDAIKKAMSSFTLPASAVPAWAAHVPESVWIAAVKEAAATGKDIRAIIQGI